MPDLRRCKAGGRGSQTWIGLSYARIGGDFGNGRQCADPCGAVRAPFNIDHTWQRRQIDQRPSGNAAATASERSVPPRAIRASVRRSGRRLRYSCDASFVQQTDQSIRPQRNLVRPDADGITNGVGDRRRRRNRRDFADTNAAAEHMIEAALIEVDIDNRRIADPGNSIVLRPPDSTSPVDMSTSRSSYNA